MQIIGITGFRRCGKNSTSQLLSDYFGFTQCAFADALRRMCVAVNPVISLEGAMLTGAVGMLISRARFQRKTEYRYTELLDELGYERAKEIPDFRHFLQKMGTEGVRDTFGPNAWVDALARRLEVDAPSRVAISDVRFHSEADWVHKQGGLLWRVIRPGVGGNDPHASEIDIPNLPADREIVAHSLEELENAVIDAFRFDLPKLPPITLPTNANDRPAADTTTA